VVLLGSALLWASGETALDRVDLDNASALSRIAIWKDTLAMVREFPVLGTGFNSFGAATLKYQTFKGPHYQEAHNDYLQVLAEGGVALGVAAAILLAIVTATIVSRFRAGGDRTDLYWMRVGAVMGLVGIAIQSAVEFSLQMPGIATLFVMVLAIALYTPSSVSGGVIVGAPIEVRRRRRRTSR
jgi:O-antigen ligase